MEVGVNDVQEVDFPWLVSDKGGVSKNKRSLVKKEDIKIITRIGPQFWFETRFTSTKMPSDSSFFEGVAVILRGVTVR